MVTQFVSHQEDQDLSRNDPLKNRYSEILISSLYFKPLPNESPGSLEVPKIEKDSTSQFILRLVKEMVRRNQEMIDFQMDQMKSRTRISLRFAVERRRMAYYRSANL